MNILVEVIPQLPQLIVTWISLFLLYLLLNKFLYNPLNNFLNQRTNEIEGDIKSAQDSKDEAEQLKLEYRAKLGEAKSESQEILNQARQRAEDLEKEMLDNAKEEAEAIKARALLDIEREKSQALQSVHNDISDMAVELASKIINTEINKNMQKDLVNSFIDEVGSGSWKN